MPPKQGRSELKWTTRSVPLRPSTNTPRQKFQFPGSGGPGKSPQKNAALVFQPAQTQSRREKRKRDHLTEDSVNSAPLDKKARPGVEVLLEQLISSLTSIVEHNRTTKPIPLWLSHLKIQLAALKTLKGPFDDSLFRHPALALPYTHPEISAAVSDISKRMSGVLRHPEPLRAEIASHVADYAPEDTSTSDIRMPFPEIIFLAEVFYVFAFVRSNASRLLEATCDQAFDQAYAAAKLLFIRFRTPEIFVGMNGLEEFKKILQTFLDDTETNYWNIEAITPQESGQILVYRQRKRSYPMIVANIKMDGDEDNGETTFFDAIRKYLASVVAKNVSGPKQLKRGIPILIIQIVGTFLVVGGAICQTSNGLPTVQRLPGAVELAEDFGYNILEAAHTFYSLTKSLPSLESEPNIPDEFQPITEAPYVGLEGGGITVTDSPWPGTVFKVKLNLSRPVGRPGRELHDTTEALVKEGLSNNAFYVLKSIYPYLDMTYGTSVHKFLAQHRFAPALYCEFAPFCWPFQGGSNSAEPRNFKPLIQYYLMEFLPLPTKERPGWVTLGDFAEAASSAVLYKDAIHDTLLHIIKLLRSKGMVHGDMRPNNIMIRVRSQDQMRPELRDDLKLIDIRIIDFDWSGQAGKARYPTVRNPDIEYWPGHDGKPILAEHDEEMIETWMRIWPSETSSVTDS